MASVLIQCEILDTGVVAIQVAENTQGKWIPHENMSLFAATCYKPMLGRIDETIDTFLVQVECFSVVLEILNIVNMDEGIK